MRLWVLLVGLGLAVTAGYACESESGGGTGTGTAGVGGTSGGGGTAGGGGTVTCLPGLETITLSPDGLNVTLDGSAAAPITFSATGTFAGGVSQPIDSTLLAWSVFRDDDTPPGTIADGVLQPYPHAGGVVHVEATDTCVAAGATVTFFLDVTVGDPTDPNDWTGAPVTGDPAPIIVYPSDETRFPRNIYRTLFQWYSQGFSEFRLVFEGPGSKVTVFSDGAHGLCVDANPAAGCWEVDEMTWNYIAGSNAGHTAQWVVDALDTSTQPPTVRRSEPIDIGFSLQDVEGAIFYWSTTSAGTRRGKISQIYPEDYIVGKPVGTTYPDGDVVKCVACHTFSRDGHYMAAPVASEQTTSLWVLEVTPAPPPTPEVKEVQATGGHGFATISPDNQYVVVSFKQDHMWMVDRATGAHVVDLPTQAFDGGTHPDWDPDGSQLIFASGNGDGPGDASLVKIAYNGGSSWGTPTEFLAPLNNQSNLWPKFSWGGDWIAFSVGKGGHGDTSAQLWLVPEAGGTPIELINANRIVNNGVTDGQHQNSLPTWAPPGDYDWIAFNSKREYGVVLGEGTQQIWVAAIDLNKAANGQDASYPAFRVPFQGLAENNHLPYWTLDINEGGGGGGVGGGGQGGAGGGGSCPDILTIGEVCDPLSGLPNDCCETGSICDTLDSGVTYICISIIPD